jgi:hypothetical protein
MYKIRLSPDQQSSLRPKIRTMQVILLALCTGVLGFAVVVGALKKFQFFLAVDQFTVIGVVFTIPCVIFSLVFRWLILPRRAQHFLNQLKIENKSDTVDDPTFEKLLETYQTSLIVCSALLEGPAFFWLLTVLISNGNAVGLGAAAALVALMLSYLPTANRLIDWIERQIDLASPKLQKTNYGR